MTFPPGSTYNQSTDVVIDNVTISNQDGVTFGEPLAVETQWHAVNPASTKNFIFRIRTVLNSPTVQVLKTYASNQTGDTSTFASPFSLGRTGSVYVEVYHSQSRIAQLIIPINAGFEEGGNGGELAFGDLEASVSVANISRTGATVNGSIMNKTTKSGTIGVYIEIRDTSNISIDNNAPPVTQVITANATITSALNSGALSPDTQYEARCFALDETLTLPLSPIATSIFRTLADVQPPPGPETLDAMATGSPLAGPSPLTVNFSSTVTGGTPPYAYSWVELISGLEYSQSPSFSATFENIGDYIMLLTVTDSGPGSDSAEVRFTVDNQLPPPPPSTSGFGLIALPLFMGAIAYVWPPEEERRKRYNKFRAIVKGGVRASKREIEKAGRFFIKEVNRR